MNKELLETCISTNFNKQTRPIVTGIFKVVNELRDFWPLTIRQVYYQLVAALVIENKISEYRKVSRIGVKMRELELIPWSAVEDRTRRTTAKRGIANVSVFLKNEMEYLFNPRAYHRCYLQHQSVYCEVTTEKDALARIMEDETYYLCTRLNIVRGQVSATMVEQIAARMEQAVMRGQEPIILHFGDFDPSGISIPRALKRNLLDRHGLQVDVRQAALRPEHITQYNLPIAIGAIKKKDPNFKEWLKLYGPDQAPCELDALKPDIIQKMIRDELSSVYDMDKYKDEKRAEKTDRRLIQRIRVDVQDYLLSGPYREYFNFGEVTPWK